MVLKLQGTDGMSNVLNGILNRMRKVVHRVNAPCVTSIVMSHVCHTVNNRISHVDVRGSHVNLGAKHLLAVLILALFHLLEEL